MKESVDQLVKKVITRLKNAKYSETTIDRYQVVLNQVVRYLEDTGSAEYSPQSGMMYLEEKKKTLKAKSYDDYSSIISQLNDAYYDTEFQAYHKATAVFNPPSIYAKVYHAYIDFRESKKLADQTIDTDRRYACDFLNDLVSNGCMSFEDVTPQLIIELVASKNGNYGTVVRHFLVFMYTAQYAPYDYSVFVSLPPKKHRLPPFYTKEEQMKIKDAMAKNDNPKRNHAIFLIATRYGFRDGNIVGLRFENVDFDNGQITIDHVKTGIRKTYPLYSDVKDALWDYIHNERPDSDIDYIFITSTTTPRKLRAVYAIFHNAIADASIDISGRTMGSHSVGRASLATEMINNGMTYELVREVLGHISEDVVTKYAALDIERLRVCAQPVKSPSGYFAQFLEGREKL